MSDEFKNKKKSGAQNKKQRKEMNEENELLSKTLLQFFVPLNSKETVASQNDEDLRSEIGNMLDEMIVNIITNLSPQSLKSNSDTLMLIAIVLSSFINLVNKPINSI